MEEIWKDIKGYEGLYQVSNLGKVRSMDRWVAHKGNSKVFVVGKLIKLQTKKNGYIRVDLSKNHKHKHYAVHRLVAQAFIPNPDNLPQVNHKDEDKTNNRVDNLEWCDNHYNITYSTPQQRYYRGMCRKVYQYTLDGEFIREWESVSEIGRQLKYTPSRICDCCNGKSKRSYNCIWSYIPLTKHSYREIIKTLIRRVCNGFWFDEVKMREYMNDNFITNRVVSAEQLDSDIEFLKDLAFELEFCAKC